MFIGVNSWFLGGKSPQRAKNTKNGRKFGNWLIWVAGSGVLLAIGALWWLCEKDDGIPFLARRGTIEWIVYPQAFDAIMHDAASVGVEFRQSFKLSAQPAKGLLGVSVFKTGEVRVNGESVGSYGEREWKRTRSVDVSRFLRVGENQIVVTVTNRLGPPAMWLRLEAGDLVIASDKEWEASIVDGDWEKAALANDAPRIRPGNYLYGQQTVGDSVRRKWFGLTIIVVIAVLGAVAMNWARKSEVRGQRSEDRGQRSEVPKVVLLAIVIFWAALFWNNIRQLPSLTGFDREGHLQYIDYVLQKRALPLADEGWQMYQPPLYYLLSALGLGAFHLGATADAAVIALRSFSAVIGLAQVILIFLCLRRLFPGRAGLQVVGLVVGGLLPANIYLSHLVTNEGLAALFVTAALYFCVRIMTVSAGELRSSRREEGQPSEMEPANEPPSKHAAPTELGEGPEGVGSYRHGAPTELFHAVRGSSGRSSNVAALHEVERGRGAWLDYVLVGVFLGLAMLTKFSALLAIPVVLVSLLRGSMQKVEQKETKETKTERSLLGALRSVWSATFWEIALVLVSMAAICGWHYARVWHHFGKPLVGNWEANLSVAWWQEPGYHTSGWCWHFGRSFVSPLFSSIFGFWDGIYSTLWGDGLCSGMAGVALRPPWNYDLMNIGYWIALLPTLLIAAGSLVALIEFLRRPSAELCLMLGLLLAFGMGIVLMSLRVPSYAQVKAFYGLPAIVPLCWAAARGWDFIAARGRLLSWIGAAGLTSWAITVGCAFWINARNPLSATMRGLNLVAEERFEEAAKEYSRALKLDSGYLQARNGLADALAHSGRIEEAEREAKLTIEQHPENAEAQFQLGSILQLEGQSQEASRHLNKAIALAPERPGVHQELALCYSRMKMFGEAIAACKAGLSRYPLDFDLLNNLAWLLATNPDAALRNGDEAVLLAERACELTSYRKPIYIGTLAAAYAEAGRFAEAVNAGERARRLSIDTGKNELAEKNQEMLELYRAGHAFHEKSSE